MNDDLSIRDARLEDAPEMSRLIVDAWLDAHLGQMPQQLWERRVSDWTYAVSEAGWRRNIAAIDDGSRPGDQTLVALRGDTIVGLAATRLDAGESAAEVGSLYVRIGEQRRGVGRALVEAVMSSYVRRGTKRLNIGVLEANRSGRAFYEALGGRVVAEREFDEEGTMLPELVYGWELVGP